jgi:transcription initiation factor TFIID TATA-box-binding protein
MTTEGLTPSTLRDALTDVGVELNAGETAGYVELESNLNLNALAIGLGLANIEYEPERFPGLIYHVDQPMTTAVLFGNGVIATVDGVDEQAVTDAILTVIERGEDLGLIEADSTPSVNVTVESIPVADILETGE